MRPIQFLISSFVFFCTISLASAQEEDATHQVIEIKAQRERMVAYQQSYEMAKKIQTASNGHVALGLRLMPARSDVRMDDIRLWLESTSTSVPVKLRDGNVFLVPIEDQIAANSLESVSKLWIRPA